MGRPPPSTSSRPAHPELQRVIVGAILSCMENLLIPSFHEIFQRAVKLVGDTPFLGGRPKCVNTLVLVDASEVNSIGKVKLRNFNSSGYGARRLIKNARE